MVFDPYYTWLGIPPKDQPPNYYQLLGIERYEANLDVIQNAADRQMAHIRTFQSGLNSAHSQKLLNEISKARVSLLTAQKKEQYDQQLQSQQQKESQLFSPSSDMAEEDPLLVNLTELEQSAPSTLNHVPVSKPVENPVNDPLARRVEKFTDLPVDVAIKKVIGIVFEKASEIPVRKIAVSIWRHPKLKSTVMKAGVAIAVLFLLIFINSHRGDILSKISEYSQIRTTTPELVDPSDPEPTNPSSPEPGDPSEPEPTIPSPPSPTPSPLTPDEKTISQPKPELSETERLMAEREAAKKGVEIKRETERLMNEKIAAEHEAAAILYSKNLAEAVRDTEERVRTIEGHTDIVRSVAFSPDGKRLASASHDGSLKIWNVITLQELFSRKGSKEKGVAHVAFSPKDNGKWLAFVSKDNKVRIWNPVTRQLKTLRGHTYDAVYGVAFSPDGQWLASAGQDFTVRVWDVKNGREIRILKGHFRSVKSVAFSPNGERLASASMDGTVKIWDVVTGRLMGTLNGHEGAVSSVACSADGKRLASASSDKTIMIWEWKRGKAQLITRIKQLEEVTCVTFSRDGKWLVSAGRDETVKIWDAATGEELLTLKGHTDAVRSVAFSPSGRKRIASASEDGTVKIWNISTILSLIAEKQITPQLTAPQLTTP